MISFPNAKINIGLNVTRRREDGYHDIETIFYPVGLKDTLEIIPSPDGRFSFTASGLTVPGAPCDNLAVRAFRLLQHRYGLPEVRMHLHKAIPMGAGMGGGSADGAFALVMVNELFSLGLDNRQLEDAALLLGSDCPFFIRNHPVYATGRGNIFTDIPLDLTGYSIRFAFPGVHVSTAEAYGGVHPAVPAKHLPELVRLPVHEWKDNVINDFEKAVFEKHPVIRDAKEQLYREGALYASMTGSGSAVYGIFT